MHSQICWFRPVCVSTAIILTMIWNKLWNKDLSYIFMTSFFWMSNLFPSTLIRCFVTTSNIPHWVSILNTTVHILTFQLLSMSRSGIWHWSYIFILMKFIIHLGLLNGKTLDAKEDVWLVMRQFCMAAHVSCQLLSFIGRMADTFMWPNHLRHYLVILRHAK